jgi:hypothetical protein
MVIKKKDCFSEWKQYKKQQLRCMLAVLISSTTLAKARIASEIPLHFSYSNIIFLNGNILLLYIPVTF